MKTFFVYIVANICTISCILSQTIINGHIENYKVDSVSYYKPFKEFGNNQLVSTIPVDNSGEFLINLDIYEPSFVLFIIGEREIALLVEPRDTLEMFVKSNNQKASLPWLNISGKNSAGNKYFNQTYNQNHASKFSGIRNVFNQYSLKHSDTLLQYIREELIGQTNWVDSLYNRELVTKEYVDYIKTGVHCLIAWEAGKLCDQHFKANTSLEPKGHIIKSKLFELVNPLNPKLYACSMGHPYYDTYFKEMYQVNNHTVDTSKVIIDEVAYISLAPPKLRNYLWGRAIMIYRKFGAHLYDYCSLYKKYKNGYSQNEYLSFMESLNLCADTVQTERIKIIDSQSLNFKDFLASNFQGQRLYVDLWATWCAPCKIEFSYYDESLFDFMKSYHIQPLYIWGGPI